MWTNFWAFPTNIRIFALCWETGILLSEDSRNSRHFKDKLQEFLHTKVIVMIWTYMEFLLKVYYTSMQNSEK